MMDASKRAVGEEAEEHSQREKRARHERATAAYRLSADSSRGNSPFATATPLTVKEETEMSSEVAAFVGQFGAADASSQSTMLEEVLKTCSRAQLKVAAASIQQLLRVDFISALPRDLALRILLYLDASSLCRIAQVNRKWNKLASDDSVWKRMCEQHIGHRCAKCGWGLPSLTLKTIIQYKADNKTVLFKDLYAEKHIIARNWKNGCYYLRTFSGHEDGVMCLQVDDQKIVSGSYDKTIRIWDIETLNCTRVLKGHSACVRALQFDGNKLVSGSMDHTIKIWNLESGECVRTLHGHDGGVLCLHYSGKRLASGSVDSTIRVWDISSGECHTLRGHTDWVNAVFLQERDVLFSASEDMSILMWDLNSHEVTRAFTGHVGPIQSIQVHHNRLLSASLDNSIKLWDVRSGRCLRTLQGHMEGVWCARFDQLRIVSGSQDGCLKVWDNDDFDTREAQQCTHSFVSHDGAINCLALSESKVVTGSDDCQIKIWDFGKM